MIKILTVDSGKMSSVTKKPTNFADGTDGWFCTALGGQARVRDSSGILFCRALDGGNLRVGMAFDGLVA